MLDKASHAAGRLGCDGNDRWTGFGSTNVLLHRVNIALTLGDAGTAITLARQVPLDKIRLAERKASLFVDVARAYTQCRPAVQRIAAELAVRSRGHVRSAVVDFAQHAGIRV